MAWLKTLLKKGDEEEAPQPELEEAVEEELPIDHFLPKGPQLAVLVPDVAGISSFRLRLFNDAAAAEEHVVSLPAEIRRGVHAFWALHEQPLASENAQTETLVLIRASEGSEVVYVVSFLDIESAHSFTRFEVRRGLDLGNVLIYWAALAQVREEMSGVTVLPQEPPLTLRHAPPAVRNQAAAAPAVERPAETAPPPGVGASPQSREQAVESNVEAEARAAVERALRRAQREAATQAAPAAETPATTAADAAGPEPFAASAPEPAESAAGDEESEIFSEIPEEQSAIEEAVVISHAPVTGLADEAPSLQEKVLYEEAVESGMIEADDIEEPLAPPLAAGLGLGPRRVEIEQAEVVASAAAPELEAAPAAPPAFTPSLQSAAAPSFGPAAEPDQALPATPLADEPALVIGEGFTPVTSAPGDEEREAGAWPQQRRASTPGAKAAKEPDAPKYDAFDIAYEVERLLNRRRLERRDGPFSGFKSPPGRF